MKKSKGYWTKERVFEEARNYETKSEFCRCCAGAYNVAWKNGWLDEMDWFKEIFKSKGYWTKERVFEEARNYETKSEFQKGNPTAYNVAAKNKWLDEMDWFQNGKMKPKKWTKETVFKEARKYQTRGEFRNGCRSAYNVARKNGWLEEMYWFIEGRLKAFTIKKNDSVYKYYWEETNTIYIGRTNDSKRREGEHKGKTDTIYKYAKENGLAVPPMEIIEENITVKEGLEREDYWVNYYKERGYNVLNTAKTGIGSGSTGAIGFGKWNRETVFKKAKEYKTRGEFKKGCVSAYNVAYRNNWLKEMPWLKLQRKINVPVLQLDKNTKEIIAEFSSIMEVERQLGFANNNISKCCNGKKKTAYGYIWRHKESAA